MGTSAKAVPVRSLSCRLTLIVRRASPCEWKNFREHHYKDHSLSGSSTVFVACLLGEPVAFCAIIPNGVNPMAINTSVRPSEEWIKWLQASYPEAWLDKTIYREHRTVVMPSFQGIGIGSLLCDTVAYICSQMGHAFFSATVHPQYGAYRERSPFWTALPTSRQERSSISWNLKYVHAWVGASLPDGSLDATRLQCLKQRISLASLNECAASL